MTRPDLPAPRSGGATRTPPQNLEAEESLLGAMLLSRDAIAAAAEVVQAEHFYKPAHAHVYDAILGLYGVGEPADAVTVAEELRRAGMLEVVGGPAALVALQASAPAISNAGRYARIIEELALLRRMIGAAGEIAELGYSRPDDVAKAVDSAESMIFTIAQHRAAGTTSNMRVLLEQSLDRLEQLFERGEAITGTPTGYLDLDELLSGLQPNALVVIGARPAMGKALALDTAVPTPSGWTTMGRLEVGDRVLDEEGRPTTVTYATPVQLGRECFEVALEDGSVLVADAEHQWSVTDHPAWAAAGCPGRSRVVTTGHMVNAGMATAGGGRPRWYLPVARPLELPEAQLPVAPRVLGARLARVAACGAPAVGPIPAPYLRASAHQRRALLSGLVAAAGTDVAADVVELRLADRALLAQARELVCSLGHKAGPLRRTTSVGPSGLGGARWRFTWSTAERASSRAVVAIRPVPSVPVRCITVDSPNSLYLVGEAMVPTHNTAFALGMATHAALHANRPSLFFSLEMSSLEITQRILCSEARVDATRMRNGKLTEADWEKISHAVGRLAEAPIWVDDNPNLTVMEIRSKARKLKSQVGDLGLVVVDYIQLMTGRNSAENRQVEVAEISRSLKILAREIETPVVALAQLNRSLEQRADKRPMLSDLRESGCVPASTRIMRADNGEEVTIGELVLSQEQPLVWSVDEHQRLVPARLTRAFPSGIKPVFRLELASGRSVEASANHPLLTIEGWRRLDELEVGGFVATPRLIPTPVSPGKWPDDELALLAHMLGGAATGSGFEYVTADPANGAFVVGAVRRLFGIETQSDGGRSCSQVRFPSPYRLTHGRQHPMSTWLEPLGLLGCRAWTRFVPEAVFGLEADRVAFFLHHLWATAGSITIGRNNRGPNVDTYYATTSRRLAGDVQRLLSRLGIQSTIGTSKEAQATSEDGFYRPRYGVRIQGADQQARFLRLVGCYGRRGECIPDALAILDGIKGNPNADLLPCRAEFVGSDELADIATSDLYWDEVVAVEPLGDLPTFDATVEGTHNFLADGVVVHNSLEQDADVVMFLYRDEIYNRDSAEQGIAEVIVAKHRSGPTGVARLAFLGQYTRFANMAKG